MSVTLPARSNGHPRAKSKPKSISKIPAAIIAPKHIHFSIVVSWSSPALGISIIKALHRDCQPDWNCHPDGSRQNRHGRFAQKRVGRDGSRFPVYGSIEYMEFSPIRNESRTVPITGEFRGTEIEPTPSN